MRGQVHPPAVALLFAALAACPQDAAATLIRPALRKATSERRARVEQVWLRQALEGQERSMARMGERRRELDRARIALGPVSAFGELFGRHAALIDHGLELANANWWRLREILESGRPALSLPDSPCEQRRRDIGDLGEEPKIDGVVLAVSDKVNLVLISAGASNKVRIGYKFTVFSGLSYVSKIAIDRVEDGWAVGHELIDFRKDPIRQGDSVSTRVFD